jgi:hypothetical protein
MRPVSAAFGRAVRGSHRMIARARVCTTYQTGTDPAGTDIPIKDGDVHLDSTADIRSTLDMTTDGTRMWPSSASSLLAPYGNEIYVERGIDFGNGTREWVSQGYFRLYSPEQDKAPNGPIRIAGKDRMSAIIDARLTAPVQYASTVTYGSVLDGLVGEVLPEVTIEWDDATDAATTNRSLIAEEDRYAFLHDLVTSLGKVMYFDYRGVLVVADPPSATDPVFEVTHGRDGVLIEMSRQLSREGVYNAVIATGEAADTDNPARGVAVDDNPNSPTWWNGRFGKVPRFYSSPFITTNAQAKTAASSLLRKSLGLPYSVDFGMVPNPALEPLDPVLVRYSDHDAAEVHVIESLTVPLAPNAAMTASTREQTLIVIGVS